MKYFILLPIVVLVASCNWFSPKPAIVIHAERVANMVESKYINELKGWMYIHQDGQDVWLRIRKDVDSTVLYTFDYSIKKDTAAFSTYHTEEMKNDFPYSFSFDSSVYHYFTFSKYHDTVCVSAKDKRGNDHILIPSIPTNSLFSANNPFKKLSVLEAIKDSIDCISILHWGGGIMQFNLTPDYVLTFVPNLGDIEPIHRDYWLQKIERGIKVKDKWTLRKIKPESNR